MQLPDCLPFAVGGSHENGAAPGNTEKVSMSQIIHELQILVTRLRENGCTYYCDKAPHYDGVPYGYGSIKCTM